jgi:uncharacterized OB-fold protein
MTDLPFRPLPPPTELGEVFWQRCAEGVLSVQRCDECGRCFFRPEDACTHCFSPRWQWIDCVGTGTVYSFTVVHRAPLPAFETPYVLAVIDVDEGFSMLSNVIGTDPANVGIGMRVDVSFMPVEGRILPMFVPLGR